MVPSPVRSGISLTNQEITSREDMGTPSMTLFLQMPCYTQHQTEVISTLRQAQNFKMFTTMVSGYREILLPTKEPLSVAQSGRAASMISKGRTTSSGPNIR